MKLRLRPLASAFNNVSYFKVIVYLCHYTLCPGMLGPVVQASDWKVSSQKLPDNSHQQRTGRQQ